MKKGVRQRIKVIDSVEEKTNAVHQAVPDNYLHSASQIRRQLSENQDKAAKVNKSIVLELQNLNRYPGSFEHLAPINHGGCQTSKESLSVFLGILIISK
ncbi:hypothetical protein CEXT_238701 [Caerostris extrusa]|uniref:Uncharacterized protein n=1 Tax=Caerostris extrusa TaxID=172846 RepID=A0AAV4Q6E3_CAEEX|nr:hypothetical protein CEXT_238701 [Caerostris extrusa]